jgi:hypothetical protein
MKIPRSFSENRLTSHLRIITAGILLSAAAAMAFVAAKSSKPSIAAQPNGKVPLRLEEKFVRNKAFADHFKTLLGRAKSSGEGSRVEGPA